MATAALIAKFRDVVKDNTSNQLWSDAELGNVLDAAIGEATLPVGTFDETSTKWDNGWESLSILIGRINILATLSGDQALLNTWMVNNKQVNLSDTAKSLNKLLEVLLKQYAIMRDTMIRYASKDITSSSAPTGGVLNVGSSDIERGIIKTKKSNIAKKNTPGW